MNGFSAILKVSVWLFYYIAGTDLHKMTKNNEIFHVGLQNTYNFTRNDYGWV